MAQMNISDKQYVLSLDSLDLSLLSHYIDKSPVEQRLLWSKPYIDGESTYYQVKLTTEDVHDEISYFERSETYKCHICNIDVPQIYFKQHTESRMHHNYKRLTEKVLDNVSKQLSINIDNNNNEVNNHVYCDICSKVISVENKEKHKKTKYHLNSFQNQKLTDNFIDLYVESKEVETGQTHHKIEFNNNYYITEKEGNDKYLELDSDTDEATHTDIDADTDTDWPSENECDNEHTNTYNQVMPSHNVLSNTSVLTSPYESSLSGNNNRVCNNALTPEVDTNYVIGNIQYLNDMITKYNLQFVMPIVEDNSTLVIVTPKGFKERITLNAFHGYKNVNSFLYCQLCRIWLDNSTNHSRSKDHVRNIVQPVNDDFIREVIINERWNHCLLCNTMIMKGSNHAAFSHKNDNQEIIPTINSPINPNNTLKTTYSDICKKYKKADDVSQHENKKMKNHGYTKENKSSLEVKVDNNTFQKDAIQNKEIYCEVCQVMVINSDMEIHEKGKRHKKKCLTISKSESQNSDNLPCSSKAVDLNQDNINNFSIEEKIIEYIKHMTHINNNELKCLVCDVTIPKIDRDIIEHVEGLKHKQFMNALLLITKIVQKSIKQFYCELCKCNTEDFINHVTQNLGHKIKFQAVLKTDLKEYVNDDPVDSDPITREYRKVYEDMLERNKIVRLSDKSSSYCNACLITFFRINEIDHMFSGWHKSSLKGKTG